MQFVFIGKSVDALEVGDALAAHIILFVKQFELFVVLGALDLSVHIRKLLLKGQTKLV
jgi:hypothetical protein